jgi:hypothetical protein
MANKHLEHIEDEILNDGISGGEAAIKILRYMGEFLSGKSGPSIKVTTKWDGAPAIVCGIDPEDGVFFVGNKSVFAKENPKICKSQEDIRKFYGESPGLARKLSDCLKYLRDCVKSGILQGDLMFTDDTKEKTIDKRRYITFRPNTITYAAQRDSPLGMEIARKKLGIVFHTKYTGKSLKESDLSSSFNITNEDFKETASVWIEKATFTDIGGVSSFSTQEKSKYDAAVNRAEGSLKQCRGILQKIQSGKKTLQIDTEFKKFFNSYVKNGQNIPPVERAFVEFAHHIGKEYDKVIQKNKTLKSQADKAGSFMSAVDFLQQNKREISMLIATYMNIQAAKLMLVDKMKKVSALNLFVAKGNTYEATTPEGFVAINGTKAVKLIDRLEFSNLNFNLPKEW